MLCGFVQPCAIRPGLFEIAAPGGSGFRDEPQVFRGMPEFEAGRELTRLDVGSLGFDDRPDRRVGEDIEQDAALELEGLSSASGVASIVMTKSRPAAAFAGEAATAAPSFAKASVRSVLRFQTTTS